MLTFFVSSSGCVKNIDTSGPMPDIIWPKPPDIPRVKFVNSISRPKDLNISENGLKKFMRLFFGPGIPALVSPHGITVDNEGRIYIVDKKFNTVNVYDRIEKKHYAIELEGEGPASPIDVAIDSNGNIYVTDSNEGVVNVFGDRGRRFIKKIGKGLMQRPTGIAVNEKTGELLVVDTIGSEVMRYGLEDLEFKGRWGGGGDLEGRLHYPTSISVSDDGDVIITDSLNFRIQKFSSDGKIKLVFGEAGDRPGYFSMPKGVATDSDGNIYVVDAMFDNVQIFDPDGRILMAFGNQGEGYGEFWLPSEIFIDSNDMIYVADTYNRRIQVFQYLKGD